MSDEPSNIIDFAAFALQADDRASFQSLEVRLLGECADLELSLYDTDGNVVACIAYSVTSKQPADFDLGRLFAAWQVWRHTSHVVA